MRKKNLYLLLPLLATVFLAGCPSHNPVPALTPSTPPPSSIPDQSKASVLPSGKALEGGTLRVHFTGGRNIGASLMGPTLGAGNSASTTGIDFQPLTPGKYRLLAYAPSFATVRLDNLFVGIDPSTGGIDPQKKILDATINLVPDAKLSGRVIDQDGRPLWGARISWGAAATLSKNDGTFLLEGAAPGKFSLHLNKTLFAGTSLTVDAVAGKTSAVGDVKLTSTTAKFALLNPSDLLEGKTIRENYSNLLSRLALGGFTEGNQSDSSIWLLIDPASLPESKCAEIAAFVASGGKLIVLGEWGGYGGGHPDEANRLLGFFGINFQTDLVRSTSNVGTPEWINVRDFSTLPLVKAVDMINLFAACSVFSVSPALTVASTGASGYRVQSTGIPVAAATQEGDGLVIAVGDSSAWSNFAAAPSSYPNLDRGNNADFMLNLFLW